MAWASQKGCGHSLVDVHDQVRRQSDIELDLVALLEEHREAMAAAWLDAIRQHMPDSIYAQCPPKDILANNLACLDVLRDLLSGQDPFPAWWLEFLSRAPDGYLQMGIQVDEVLQAGFLLRKVIRPFLGRIAPLDSPVAREATDRLDVGADQVVSSLVKSFFVKAGERLQQQQRHTALMLDMVQTASSTLELDDVLRRTARGIAQAAGADHCIFMLVDSTGQSTDFWAATDQFPPEVAAVCRELLGKPYAIESLSLTRLAFEAQRPVACHDALDDPSMNRRTAERLGIKSMLSIPCIVKGQVVAVANAVTFDRYHTFTPEEIDLALGVATSVAPAIENARLYQQVEQLAVTEERLRLSREIHDEQAQALGLLQLQASTARDLLAQGRLDEAQSCLLKLQDTITDVYTSVREEIFNLRTVVSDEADFMAALRAYLADYQEDFGLQVRLEIVGDLRDQWASRAGGQVLRIIQEALSNARKHSGAQGVVLRIEENHTWARVSIEDEGQGFSPERVLDQGRRHVGLTVMQERAHKVGGTLVIDSQPGQGTRILLQVPFSPNQEAL